MPLISRAMQRMILVGSQRRSWSGTRGETRGADIEEASPRLQSAIEKFLTRADPSRRQLSFTALVLPPDGRTYFWVQPRVPRR